MMILNGFLAPNPRHRDRGWKKVVMNRSESMASIRDWFEIIDRADRRVLNCLNPVKLTVFG
jgi:hypothetical protein